MNDDPLDIVRRARRGAVLQAVFGIAAAAFVLGATVVAYTEIRDLRGQLETLERGSDAPEATAEEVTEQSSTAVDAGRVEPRSEAEVDRVIDQSPAAVDAGPREGSSSEAAVDAVIEPVPGPGDIGRLERPPSEATAEEVDRADPRSR